MTGCSDSPNEVLVEVDGEKEGTGTKLLFDAGTGVVGASVPWPGGAILPVPAVAKVPGLLAIRPVSLSIGNADGVFDRERALSPGYVPGLLASSASSSCSGSSKAARTSGGRMALSSASGLRCSGIDAGACSEPLLLPSFCSAFSSKVSSSRLTCATGN